MKTYTLFWVLATAAFGQQAPTHAKRYHTLAIRNATIVDGNGTPASGPKDIIITDNLITAVIALDPRRDGPRWPQNSGGCRD